MGKKKRVHDFTGKTKIWREDGRVSVGLSSEGLPPGLRLSTASDSEVGKALLDLLGSVALQKIDLTYSLPDYGISTEDGSVVLAGPWGHLALAENVSPEPPGFRVEVSGEPPADVEIKEAIFLANTLVEIVTESGWSTARFSLTGWPLLNGLLALALDDGVDSLVPVGAVRVHDARRKNTESVFLRINPDRQLWAYVTEDSQDSLTRSELNSLLYVRQTLVTRGVKVKALVSTRSGSVPSVLDAIDASADVSLLHHFSDQVCLVTPAGVELIAEMDTNDQEIMFAKRGLLSKVRRRDRDNKAEVVCDSTERELVLQAARVGLSYYGVEVEMIDEGIDPLERARSVIEGAKGKSATELVTLLAEAGLLKR